VSIRDSLLYKSHEKSDTTWSMGSALIKKEVILLEKKKKIQELQEQIKMEKLKYILANEQAKLRAEHKIMCTKLEYQAEFLSRLRRITGDFEDDKDLILSQISEEQKKASTGSGKACY